MIFYSVFYWIILMLAVSGKWFFKNELKQWIFLLIFNVVFLFLLSPANILFLSGLIFINFLCKKAMDPWKALIVSLVFGILLKKYFDLTTPLHVSFIMLSVLGTLTRLQKMDLKKFAKSTLFTLVQVGPIVRSEEVSSLENDESSYSLSFVNIFSGFISLSLASALLPTLNKPLTDSLDLVLHFFIVLNLMFLNFQGAVLIARGSSELLGFKVPSNFNRPYFARSLQEFWKRWHISMGNFFSENVYRPVQLAFLSKIEMPTARQVQVSKLVSLLITWSLIGIWHKPTFLFFIWGLFNAVFVFIPAKKFKLDNIFATLFLIYLSHLLFLAEDVGSLSDYLVQLQSLRFLTPGSLMPKIIGIVFNLGLFFLSQHMFSWAPYIKNRLLENKWLYYTTIVCLFLLSLVYYYKDQIIIYGQF